jgi:signal transduction histidine kinase
VITDVVRSLWAEPRAPGAPRRVWRDVALLVVLAVCFVVESVVRSDVPWRPVGLVEVIVLGYALWNRRAQPFAMVALSFGTVIVVDTVAMVVGVSEVDGAVSPYSMGFLLVLVYALFRWGSGREVAWGSLIAITAAVVGLIRDHTSLVDSILGFVVLTFPAAAGATVRFWSTSRARQIDAVRLMEREQLARELHDTVAHHVSAMVIRAQAGRVVAATSPAAAVEALEIIESEGSRTLAEMRAMVGALRQGDDAELTPQAGIAALPGLARADGGSRIEVRTAGDLAGLGSAVESAVYRIAQESVTNALRHSRGARHIVVQVVGGPDGVDVSIVDDGDPVPPGRSYDGFGIVGMSERAALLGGTLVAGPGPERGWDVRAHLPRNGSAA